MTFWFEEAGPAAWFRQSDQFDATVRLRFEEAAIDIAAKSDKSVHSWENDPDQTLALIIALDQFPRNMYRGTKAAFAWDRLALACAERMTDKGWDLKIPQTRRSFVYMPFMHSENLKHQDTSVNLCDARLISSSSLHHAKEHRKLIKKFGRFPHRNIILGRESRMDELSFLEKGGYNP